MNDSAFSEDAIRSDTRRGVILMDEQEIQEEIVESTDSTAETAPAVEEPSTAERTFTQTEVNALLAKESSRLRRKLRKQKPEQPTIDPLPPEPKEESTTLLALEKVLDRIERLETMGVEKSREDSFNHLIGDREVDEDLRVLLYQGYDPKIPERTEKMLSKLASSSESSGYISPGAPAKGKDGSKSLNPLAWSKDDIEVLKREGRFLESLEQWRAGLPGGGNALMATKFRKQKRG
jgi:hypothetical protein